MKYKNKSQTLKRNIKKNPDSMDLRNRTKHNFLLTFFDQNDGYAEKQVNGFWLVKQFQKKIQQWVVAIYTPQNYQKKKKYQQKHSSRGISRSENK